nr:MAG TPA: hypothetical protein [Caudoviricetes sp.]
MYNRFQIGFPVGVIHSVLCQDVIRVYFIFHEGYHRPLLYLCELFPLLSIRSYHNNILTARYQHPIISLWYLISLVHLLAFLFLDSFHHLTSVSTNQLYNMWIQKSIGILKLFQTNI